MVDLQKIKEIINAGGRKIKKDDKIYILTCCEELSIPHGVKLQCKDCFIDLAFKILEVSKEQSEETEEKPLRLKQGVRILVNGKPINAVTCDTPEKCRKAISFGTPKRYFENYED